MPDTNVNPPEPTERFPLIVKLPVPPTTPFAARKSIVPVAPVVNVRVAFNVISRFASMVMEPPVETFAAMVMLPAAAIFALSVMLPVPALVIVLLTMMLFEAVTVSALELFHATASTKVIFPVPPEPAALVMVTAPLANAFCNVVTFRFDAPLPVESNGEDAVMSASIAVLIVTSVGSRSSIPLAPWLAWVFTVPLKPSQSLPEISMKPPLPRMPVALTSAWP